MLRAQTVRICGRASAPTSHPLPARGPRRPPLSSSSTPVFASPRPPAPLSAAPPLQSCLLRSLFRSHFTFSQIASPDHLTRRRTPTRHTRRGARGARQAPRKPLESPTQCSRDQTRLVGPSLWLRSRRGVRSRATRVGEAARRPGQ